MDEKIQASKKVNPNSAKAQIMQLKQLNTQRAALEREIAQLTGQLDDAASDDDRFCLEAEIDLLKADLEGLKVKIQRKKNRITKLNQSRSAKAAAQLASVREDKTNQVSHN